MRREPMADFLLQERKFVAETKPLLPIHSGESRYQAMLDSDTRYRDLVLSGFALALFASSGFGNAAQSVGSVRGALFCLAVAGLGLKAVAPRVVECGSMAKLVLLVVAGFAGVGCILGGTHGFTSIGIAVVAAGLAVLCTVVKGARPVVVALGGILLLCSSVWSISHSDPAGHLIESLIGALLAALLVVRSSIANTAFKADLRPSLVLSSFAAYAWIIDETMKLGSGGIAVLTAAAACAVYAVSERAVIARNSFAPVVIAMILVQLVGFLEPTPNQPKLIPLHIAVMLVEFAILGMAGYRQTFAALSRFPIATYRSSPQCLVPCADHAWDHPVRIDAV